MEFRDKGAGMGSGATPVVPASSAPARATGDLYRGANDGLTRAFEIAVIPPLFGAAGYSLDRWIGIVPVLTIAFVLLACVGLGVRMWYAYAASMAAQEQGQPWARTASPESRA